MSPRFIRGLFVCNVKCEIRFTKYLYKKDTPFRVFFIRYHPVNFTMVFHRILDFKAGLDFYPGPLFFLPYAAFLVPCLIF